jgi:methylmalonyl-CoA/ethylmalonyl-CoA epimerase
MEKILENCFLDHVAIAVNNIEEAKKIYEAIGFKFDPKREKVESQKVMTAFAHIDTHAHIELLEPTEAESPIAKFIASHGTGIHHLSFMVKDVRAKQKELESLGYKLLYPEPREGANQTLVNFIHPKSAGGVLIEISEKVMK